MADIDAAHLLTSTYDTSDLRAFVEHAGPFVTIAMRTPSEFPDSERRINVKWRNARRELAGRWPTDRLEELDAHIGAIDRRTPEAVIVCQAADGTIFSEMLTFDIVGPLTVVEDTPRLTSVIEHRQRTMPHIVVVTDRTGADIAGFDGGGTVAEEVVEGETLHITRSHPGGWSQRRYQQRAENRWEENAGAVADAVVAMSREVRPVMIAVAGDVRARNLLVDELSGLPSVRIVNLEHGSAAAITDEVFRQLADLHARGQRQILDDLRSRGDSLTTTGEVMSALQEGRVATLLVTPDRSAEGDTGRLVDDAVRQALLSNAAVVVVPSTPDLPGGVSAIVRW